MKKIRVAVIDDHSVVRMGLMFAVRMFKDMEFNVYASLARKSLYGGKNESSAATDGYDIALLQLTGDRGGSEVVNVHFFRAYQSRSFFTAHMGSQTDKAVQSQGCDRTADTFVFLFDLKLKGAVTADFHADPAYFRDRGHNVPCSDFCEENL